MQAIRNKFHSKSKRSSAKHDEYPADNTTYARTVSSGSAHAETFVKETHEDFPGGHVDRVVKTEILPSTSSSAMMIDSIPIPPPMPPTEYWMTGKTYTFEEMDFATLGAPGSTTRTIEMLPVEVIERPLIVHENIRQEQIEEITAVIQVEREKTEIRQITQPLMDKEIMPVFVEERTLPMEVLPTITHDFVAAPAQMDISSRTFDSTMRQVIEKTPIIRETEKWRIIEEVQPIIYRETIIPHIIRTSRPMREVIVDAPVFMESVHQSREVSVAERELYSKFFAQETVLREVIPASSIPIMAMPDIHVIPTRTIAAPVPVAHRKEIIEETTTTTTTTTVAPTVGSSANLRSSSVGSATMSAPVLVGQTHAASTGPMGEKILTDTVTTNTYSQAVMPTRVI